MGPELFEIQILSEPDGRCRVRVSGELDLLTAPELDRRLMALRGGGRHLVLDLGGVSFIDSAGIELLCRQAQHASLDGWVFAIDARLPRFARYILELSGVHDFLPFDPPAAPGTGAGDEAA